MKHTTPRSQERRATILAMIKTRALTAEDIGTLAGIHKTTASGYLNQLLTEGLVKVRKQYIGGGLERYYWIDINAADDAPLSEAEDAEEAINRDAKAKLAQIKPHTDWSQFWIPVRNAA